MADNNARQEGESLHGKCDCCGGEVIVDGDEAAEFGSRILGRCCFDLPVTFHAECETCSWKTTVESREAGRVATRQNVQMRANNHEKEKRVIHNENHETAWEEVGDV